MMNEKKGRESPLSVAMKIGEEAAQRGFDWEDLQGPLAKLREEIDELAEVLTREEGMKRAEEELGDILFSVVNVARHLGCDPEVALARTNAKFQRRLELVFQQVKAAGKEPEEVGIEELEAHWQKTKGLETEK